MSTVKDLQKFMEADFGHHTSSVNRIKEEFAKEGRTDLYFFCKGVLGYSKLVPHAHGHLCIFTQTCPSHRRMIQMPRSHFKTTIDTIAHSMQLIAINPEIRILLVAASGDNASRFMTEIQNHWKRNDIFRWLYPELIPPDFSKVRWNSAEMEVPRKGTWREPTIDTIGSRGAVESRHYDWIKADDIIGEKEFNSDTEMEKTCEWCTGLESLLISPTDGYIDFIGTRWKATDVYAFMERFYSHGEKRKEFGTYAWQCGELVLFTRGARENGKPIFPELVTEQFLSRLQRENPQRYAAQYANDPIAAGTTIFEQDWLKWYNLEYNDEGPSYVVFTDREETTYRLSVWSLDRYVLFDPSVGEGKRACRQALVTVGVAEVKGRIYFFLLDTAIGIYLPDQAVTLMLEMDQKWNPVVFSIESFAYQASIKYWLRERCAYEHIAEPAIREYPPKGVRNSVKAKADRIRGLQPLFRNGQFFVQEGQSEFLEEYLYYPNGMFKDSLDALSQITAYVGNSWDEEIRDGRKAYEDKILACIGPTGYSINNQVLNDWVSEEADLDNYEAIKAAGGIIFDDRSK